MKQILFLILLSLSFSIKSQALVYDIPLHVRCSSYPANAAKVYAVNYRYGYFCFSNYQLLQGYQELTPKDYFDIFAKEKDYDFSVDLKRVIAHTYSSCYLVRLMPVDNGYSFVGLSRAQYIGKGWDWLSVFNDVEIYNSYFRLDTDSSDFVFNPENIDDKNYHDCQNEYGEDNKYIYCVDRQTWVAGYVNCDYMKENEDGTCVFVGDPNCFPENPNEYLYAVFARVVISNFKEKEVYLYPRANEIGDEVTLTCTRDDFDYWIEEGTGRHIAKNPYTFTVTGKETYTAHFGDPSKIAFHQLPSGKESSSLTAHPSSVYDLQGRKVNVNDKKGIYIKNGRKQVIR